MREGVGIQLIRLRQPPDGAREIPHLARVHHRRRQPRRRQRPGHVDLEAAGGLKHDQRGLARAQPAHHGR
jgi:hypothetical protein